MHQLVDAGGISHHWAYDSYPGAGDCKGSSRLSYSFCVLGSEHDLVLAARRRPRLARLYAEVEEALGHQFKLGMPMRKILDRTAQDNGSSPGVVLDEDTEVFHALELVVRAPLRERTKLRGSTAFTAVPACATSCSGCR